MIQNLAKLVRTTEKFTIDNSPLILTFLGVTGAVTSVLLTGQATFRAAEILSDYNYGVNEDIPIMEQVKLVWPLYVAPVGTLALTITSIVMAHQIHTGRTAALAAAYSISEKAFDQYKDKVVNQIGKKKEEAIKAEVSQDRLNESKADSKQVIISSGEVLCFDEFSGRYFNGTVEGIRQAVNDINYEILNNNYASLSDFYDHLGLDRTSESEEVGWTLDRKLELHISTIMSKDGRPCVSIDFTKGPVRDYFRF